MPTRTIPVAPADAPAVVRAAFEGTRAIQSYHHDAAADRVVGKTGTSVVLGTSYGERVTIAYRPAEDGGTELALSAEPILGTNVFAKPTVYRDQVARELDAVLNRSDPVGYASGICNGQEVPTADEQAGMIVGGKNYSIGRFILLVSVLGGLVGGFGSLVLMTALLG